MGVQMSLKGLHCFLKLYSFWVTETENDAQNQCLGVVFMICYSVHS